MHDRLSQLTLFADSDSIQDEAFASGLAGLQPFVSSIRPREVTGEQVQRVSRRTLIATSGFVSSSIRSLAKDERGQLCDWLLVYNLPVNLMHDVADLPSVSGKMEIVVRE